MLPRGEEREEIRNSVRKGKIGGAFLFFGDFYHRDVDLERRKYSNLKAFYLVAKVVNKIGRLKFNYPSGEWKRGCSRKDFSEEGRGRRECTVNTAGLERASRYIPF